MQRRCSWSLLCPQPVVVSLKVITKYLASFPGLPCFLICTQYNTQKRKSTLNATKSSYKLLTQPKNKKTGEAWEWSYQMSTSPGHVEVPVADCTAEKFSSHPKTKMKFADFISYWKTISTTCSDPPNTCTDEQSSSLQQKTRLLYLKDWHFVRCS